MTKMSMSSPLVTYRDPREAQILAAEASVRRLSQGIQEVRTMCLDLVDAKDWRVSMKKIQNRLNEIDQEVTAIHQHAMSSDDFLSSNRRMIGEARALLESISGMLAAKEAYQMGIP